MKPIIDDHPWGSDLEDILSDFGATADFWSAVRDADKDVERDEASRRVTLALHKGEDAFQRARFNDDIPDERILGLLKGLRQFSEEVESLIIALPGDQGRALMNRIIDESLLSDKPMYACLAEIYAEKGDTEFVARAHERAYQTLLEDCPDPQDLCSLGYLLLERCGVDELPLRVEEFNSSIFEFGNDDTLLVSHLPPFFPDATVQSFSNEAETLRLAMRAFGLSWLYYYERAENKSEAWLSLFALDGLRAGFLHADNLEALQVVTRTFWYWTDDYFLYSHSACDDFVANFREAAAYVQGCLRRNAADREAAKGKLAAGLGDVWHQVPLLAQQYLISSEILFQLLDRKGDWSGAVNDLSKAAEAVLRQSVGHHCDSSPTEPFARLLKQAIDQGRKRPVRKVSRVSLSTFKDALVSLTSDQMGRAVLTAWVRQAATTADEQWVDELINQVEQLVRKRTRADHAVQPGEPWKISLEEAEQVRDLCIGTGRTGLVLRLAQLQMTRRGNNG